MKKTFRLACASCLLAIVSMPAQAERADREKPVQLEADRMSIDDLNKVQVLEGNVILIQGTLQILTNRLVVTQDADGFQKGTATGGANGLARFKQKRDGKDDYVEGEAERIDYDARAEKSEFFNRAWVKSGLDEVRGAYISYDALNEKYLVTTGSGASKSATGAAQARVRAIIQPRSKNENPAAPKGDPLTLKPAQSGK
ncbi:lipopolysaccharide transport periplasmic protein LptA [Candidatus Accumulibacter sp. ACC007]|uniref:lipopolysaccharide transport periplasmic protein LptA n=1 Tax=Candidatus Accumulibacter sp. ACC007 TaxID=2823333 RepID=UPI0025BB4B9A|nr:lipopolysaccharide transport periplasmic protein LptA [Candidatus Accumulibacter sp. ACC007]